LLAVVKQVALAAEATRHDWSEGDPMLDVYIYVSGNNWQHERSGIRLGTLSARGRDSLRVMLYVPDHLTSEEDARAYFAVTLSEAATLVRKRLTAKRPAWPVEKLTADLLSLQP
jgi:hypothetical protein